jgi:hypothetical protein
LEQDGAPVKVQKLFLAAAEPSHIGNLRGVYAHSLERGTMSDRGDYELPAVLEANEAAIEEMIDARCQKQSVLAIEPLLVCRVTPRFAVTSYEVPTYNKKKGSAKHTKDRFFRRSALENVILQFAL